MFKIPGQSETHMRGQGLKNIQEQPPGIIFGHICGQELNKCSKSASWSYHRGWGGEGGRKVTANCNDFQFDNLGEGRERQAWTGLEIVKLYNSFCCIPSFFLQSGVVC